MKYLLFILILGATIYFMLWNRVQQKADKRNQRLKQEVEIQRQKQFQEEMDRLNK